MCPVECSPPEPMAAQMARLLCDSDRAELEEIVRRWIAEAPDEHSRQIYQTFGRQLVELSHALDELPRRPSRPELEFHLDLMLKLAVTQNR